MHIRRASAAAGAVLAGLLVATVPSAAAAGSPAASDAADVSIRPAQGQETRRVEYFPSPHAQPRQVEVPPATPSRPGSGSPPGAADGEVTPIVENGPVGDKLDVAVIGDGYTTSQLTQFHTDAKAKWNEITGVEPYTTYQNLFNVWAVDAVSAQSGVSGDPGQGVVRDTALDSYFWCAGTERLLCVDTDKVESYAARAPEADLVIVVANSSKYGGAGYNDVVSQLGYDGIATVSGGNADSGQIAVHETGHSLGKLADEYVYEEYGQYTGPEPAEVNSSVHTAQELASLRTKWYRWLGEPTPDGGTIGAFEGSGYYPAGLHRPSQNSLMRSLNREFNVVGREAMITGFYRHASALASSVPTAQRLSSADTVTVSVPQLTGAAEEISLRWYVDGREVRSLRRQRSVAVASLVLPGDRRPHQLAAVAHDPTLAVRDPQLRPELTDSLTWTVRR